jgi:hypothetical protein
MSSLMSFTGNLGVTHGGIFIAHSHGMPRYASSYASCLQPPPTSSDQFKTRKTQPPGDRRQREMTKQVSR